MYRTLLAALTSARAMLREAGGAGAAADPARPLSSPRTRIDEDLPLRAGDWVQVRSAAEILSTLDARGQLEGMPFMPEMLAYCGQRFQVYKRAHKTCDTVFPVRSRRVNRAVHLATRCSGLAHGGCQAACLLFWKEAWLRRVEGPWIGQEPVRLQPSASGTTAAEAQLAALTIHPDSGPGEPVFVCQATRLPYATSPLAWWDLRQYVEDYRSGNVGLRRILLGLCYSAYYNLSQAGIGVGRPMELLYDLLHPLWGGTAFPRKKGKIPVGDPTPAVSLGLQAGELVRVKPHAEILKTVSKDSRNRGLWWDAEMVPYCGKVYRVLSRVNRILDERTGRMLEMKTPCIILENVVCQSRYSTCRYFCPRSIYPYWREIWLERVDADAVDGRPPANV